MGSSSDQNGPGSCTQQCTPTVLDKKRKNFLRLVHIGLCLQNVSQDQGWLKRKACLRTQRHMLFIKITLYNAKRSSFAGRKTTTITRHNKQNTPLPSHLTGWDWNIGERDEGEGLGTVVPSRLAVGKERWTAGLGWGEVASPLCMWLMRSFFKASPLMSESLSLKSLSPFPLSLPLNFSASRPEMVLNEWPFQTATGGAGSFPKPGEAP